MFCNIRPKYVHVPIPNILHNSSSNFEHFHLKSLINHVSLVCISLCHLHLKCISPKPVAKICSWHLSLDINYKDFTLATFRYFSAVNLKSSLLWYDVPDFVFVCHASSLLTKMSCPDKGGSNKELLSNGSDSKGITTLNSESFFIACAPRNFSSVI